MTPKGTERKYGQALQPKKGMLMTLFETSELASSMWTDDVLSVWVRFSSSSINITWWETTSGHVMFVVNCGQTRFYPC